MTLLVLEDLSTLAGFGCEVLKIKESGCLWVGGWRINANCTICEGQTVGPEQVWR